MVNIWKIGSAPALWGNEKTPTDKKRYIKYALGYEAEVKEGFVAIGYGWIPDIKKLYAELGEIKAEEKIKEYLEEHNKGKIWKRTEEIRDFALNIKEKDVILLYYTKSKAHVGLVKKPYYYVLEGDDRDYFGNFDKINRAPHRIDVDWQFKDSKVKLFDGVNLTWFDTVHQVLEMDLDKIENEELKNYLENKLRE